VPGTNIDSRSIIEFNGFNINSHENIVSKEKSVNIDTRDEILKVGVRANQSTKIGCYCIGEESHLGAGSLIENSIIGSKSHIAENTEVYESIIHNKVVIESGCDIRKCIIAEGVKIEKGTKIDNKLVISHNDAYIMHDIKIDELIDSSIVDSEESDLLSEETDEEQKLSFEDEIRAIVLREINEDHGIDSIKIEINSVRFSENKTLADCLVAIIPPLIDSVLRKENLVTQSAIIELDTLFGKYADFLKTFIITSNDQALLIE